MVSDKELREMLHALLTLTIENRACLDVVLATLNRSASGHVSTRKMKEADAGVLIMRSIIQAEIGELFPTVRETLAAVSGVRALDIPRDVAYLALGKKQKKKRR